MNTYSIKISKGNGLKAFISANSKNLCVRLDSFKEKGFVIERVRKTHKGVTV